MLPFDGGTAKRAIVPAHAIGGAHEAHHLLALVRAQQAPVEAVVTEARVLVLVCRPISPLIRLSTHEKHRRPGNRRRQTPPQAGLGPRVPIPPAAGEFDEVPVPEPPAVLSVGDTVVRA